MSNIRSATQLREDAQAIWQAGVDAVKSDQLVEHSIEVGSDEIRFGELVWEAAPGSRVWVVGAGKAGAGMVLGLERAFGRQGLEHFQVDGWVNVPADCMLPTSCVKLHAARPAGINQPTAEGVVGTREILERVEHAKPQDLVICLISGGGSALLPAPIDGIQLADKQAITQRLSLQGANIAELNAVRSALSQIKGGGLARHCGASTLITLIISDVLGDPLDVIASGPTAERSPDPDRAIEVLQRFDPDRQQLPASVYAVLDSQSSARKNPSTGSGPAYPRINVPIVIGNNAVAVDAAGMEAERRGYSHAMVAATKLEGPVEEIAAHHARMALRMLDQSGPDCLITGGEPIVELPPGVSAGKGGRNQQLSLLASQELAVRRQDSENPLAGICLLSGGTDGEDGPTNAAGGRVDAKVMSKARELGLDIADFSKRFDAYPFLEATGGLILSGPTHTNVCDLRVIVVERIEPQMTRSRPG